MKDNLFDMLMSFFEKSLSRLKEKQVVAEDDLEENFNLEHHSLFIKDAQNTAIRIFTEQEQQKFSGASYQFLMRLINLQLIAQETMEFIINQLLFSESRFVSLQETKWTIRNTLANNLNVNQLAFLDLVLYQKEDELPLH